MATVKVRADRALEAAERLLGKMKQAAGADQVTEVEAVAAACRLALQPRFGDGSGLVALTGPEAARLLPHFQEPPEL